MKARAAKIERETTETKVSLELGLDGTGQTEINTGIKLCHDITTQKEFILWEMESVILCRECDLLIRSMGRLPRGGKDYTHCLFEENQFPYVSFRVMEIDQ